MSVVPAVEKTTYLQEDVTPELLQSMREGVTQAMTGVPQREAQENDAIPKVAPKWLKHDRQVSPIAKLIQTRNVSRLLEFKLNLYYKQALF